jgi:hypothetical protein
MTEQKPQDKQASESKKNLTPPQIAAGATAAAVLLLWVVIRKTAPHVVPNLSDLWVGVIAGIAASLVAVVTNQITKSHGPKGD